MTGALPEGTVTFLFTDIEGSTARWEADPDAMSLALKAHDRISAEQVRAAGGEVFKMTGDGICAAFADASAAVAAAEAISTALGEEAFPETIAPVRVRAGIHSGPAEVRDNDYFGPTLNRVARLMAAGNGGQVLVSGASRALLGHAGVELVDLGEHRLRDLLRPEHVFSVPGPQATAPLRVLDTSNLPVQATPFLGREGDLFRLGELIPQHRLVTLTGPGGTGKTRLALQVAADLLDRFDGVFFVGLGSLLDASGVIGTVAASIGVAPGSADLDRRVAERLASGRNLVVLDNFEHVMEAAPLVGRLLEQAPECHFLVTSRQLLRLRAERHYPVEPLEVPVATGADPEVLASYESVRLFVERATAVDAGFTLDSSNAQAVAAICVRLDGLPLAIELAAARIRLFRPTRLLAELEAGLAVLSRGPVDAPERHQALRETIRWSYDLLEGDEKIVFDRLGVFVGGAPLESVEPVCLMGLDSFSIDMAETLSDKSLVRIDTNGEDIRLDMLETIHDFARNRLREAPDGPDIHAAHAAFFVGLAENAGARLRGRDQRIWIGRLSDDNANITAALTWAFAEGDRRVGLRFVAALRDYWFFRGLIRDMAAWVERALVDLPDPDEDPVLRAGVLLTHGFSLHAVYDSRAIEVLDEAARLLAPTDERRLHALATIWAGGGRESLLNSIDEAREMVSRGLDLARDVGDLALEGQALNMLGEMERSVGNYEEAKRIQEEALLVSRASGEDRRVAMLLHNLGLIAHRLGHDDEARRLLVESLEISIDRSFDMEVAHSLIGLAEQIALGGDGAMASRVLGAAKHHFDRLGFMPQPADRPDYDRIEDEVRDAAGDDVFAREVAIGATLDLPAAVELVIGS